MRNLLVALGIFLISFSGTSVYQEYDSYHTPRSYVNRITDGTGSGSAVTIAPGFALTAAHVLKGRWFKLTINGLKVEKAWMNEQSDVGLVYVPNLECPCSPLGENLLPDERVVAVGFPMGLHKFATEGRSQGVSLDMTTNDMVPRMFVSSPIIYGNSGGGAFAFQWLRWKLVGITVEGAMLPDVMVGHPITFMTRIVPISTIYDFFNQLDKYELVREQKD